MSTTIPSTSPTSTDIPPNNGVATSSSLYLYTFLATLVLLLGVSSAIVLRSLILRRRHRRMIAEAIANGTWPSPITGYGPRGRSKNFGEKPKVYNVALGKLVPDDEDHTSGAGKEKETIPDKPGDLTWNAFLPVSASYLPTKPTISTPTSPSATSLQPSLPSGRIRSYFNRGYRAPSPRTPTTPPAAAVSESDVTTTTTSDLKKVRVAVLIAMPSPNPSPFIHNHIPPEDEEKDEEELPHMEFGVAELVVAGKSVEEDSSSSAASEGSGLGQR